MNKIENKRRNLLRGYTFTVPALLALVCLGGCAAPAPEEQPRVYGIHYLDEGGTIVVEDPFMTNGVNGGTTLLEKLKKTSEELKVQSEKNALLIQEMSNIRDARDSLHSSLEEAKNKTLELNEKIAGLKVDLADLEGKLQQAFQEKKDLLEQVINLKLENVKNEKELLKVKIASLSGEG